MTQEANTATAVEATATQDEVQVEAPEEQHIPVPDPEALDSQKPVTDEIFSDSQTKQSQSTNDDPAVSTEEPKEQASTAQ